MIKIRRFQKQELQQACKVIGDVFASSSISIEHNIERVFGRINNTTWRQRKINDVRIDIKNNPHGVFVAVDNERVIGIVTTVLYPFDSVGRIIDLAVSKKYQGRGIGRKLIDKALVYFKSRKIKYAKIETLTGNKVGSRFYPKIGFKLITTQNHYLKRI